MYLIQRSSALFLLFLLTASLSQSQPVLVDDFESYPPYQLCPNYSTDIQVYPTHGTNSSQGLRAFMNSFDSKDTLLINWIKPLQSAYVDFDFRMMEASALYPNIAATLDTGDQFSLRYTTDNQSWVVMQNWKVNNFVPTTAFTHVHLPMPPCDSAKFKFVVTRSTNPTDYFVDIDNLDISNSTTALPATPVTSDIRISPSPFNDYLRIQAPAARAYSYELIDLRGTVVESGDIQDGETLIRTQHLADGNYMVRINGTDRVKTFRVAKAR